MPGSSICLLEKGMTQLRDCIEAWGMCSVLPVSFKVREMLEKHANEQADTAFLDG